MHSSNTPLRTCTVQLSKKSFINPSRRRKRNHLTCPAGTSIPSFRTASGSARRRTVLSRSGVVTLLDAFQPVARQEFLFAGQASGSFADPRAQCRRHLQYHKQEDHHPDFDAAARAVLMRAEASVPE